MKLSFSGILSSFNFIVIKILLLCKVDVKIMQNSYIITYYIAAAHLKLHSTIQKKKSCVGFSFLFRFRNLIEQILWAIGMYNYLYHNFYEIKYN